MIDGQEIEANWVINTSKVFKDLKLVWLNAQAAQTDHACGQEQVCYEAWWISSNNTRDGKGMRKLANFEVIDTKD